MRRLIKAIIRGEELGDCLTIEDEVAIEEIKKAVESLKSEYRERVSTSSRVLRLASRALTSPILLLSIRLSAYRILDASLALNLMDRIHRGRRQSPYR